MSIDKFKLNGKSVLITGATGLLGRSLCLECASLGADIIGVYLSNDDKAAELQLKIEELGQASVFIKQDLSDQGAIQSIYKQAIDRFGGVDVAILAAALKHRQAAMFTKAEVMVDLMKVNCEQSFLLAQKCMRSMIVKKWGRIILIGSYSGLNGMPGQALYAASKGALSSWVKSVAFEVGSHQITVNLVSPGTIQNEDDPLYTDEERQTVVDKIGLKRMADPGEVSSVITFLSSDAAAYINGAEIEVNGGARY